MHRISRDEYDATHRIFTHVESIIGPYYGRKTRQQTEGFVSENRWIMFPEYHVESLRDGAQLPIPNVFVSFEEDSEVVDNGQGQVNGWMGLTYHNVEAMQWLMGDILRRSKKRDLFINMLRSLNDEWDVEIQNKTMTDCPFTTPKYRKFRGVKPSSVDATFIQQAVADSDRQLLRGPGMLTRIRVIRFCGMSLFS